MSNIFDNIRVGKADRARAATARMLGQSDPFGSSLATPEQSGYAPKIDTGLPPMQGPLDESGEEISAINEPATPVAKPTKDQPTNIFGHFGKIGEGIKEEGGDPMQVLMPLLGIVASIATKGKAGTDITREALKMYNEGQQGSLERKQSYQALEDTKSESKRKALENKLADDFRSELTGLDIDSPDYTKKVRAAFSKYYPEKSAGSILKNDNYKPWSTRESEALISLGVPEANIPFIEALAETDPDEARKVLASYARKPGRDLADVLLEFSSKQGIAQNFDIEDEKRKEAAAAQEGLASLSAYIQAAEKAPAVGRGGGLVGSIQAMIGTNPEAKILMSMRSALAGTLAKAFGESGRLSDFDIQRVQSMAPSVYDTKEERSIKINLLKALVDKTISPEEASEKVKAAWDVVGKSSSGTEEREIAPGVTVKRVE